MTYDRKALGTDPYANSTKRSIFTNQQDGENQEKKPDYLLMFKNREFFSKLSVDERQRLFRLKSAKKDKKIEKE